MQQKYWWKLQKGMGIRVKIIDDIDKEMGKQKYRPAIVIKSYPSRVKVQLMTTEPSNHDYFKTKIDNQIQYIRSIYYRTINFNEITDIWKDKFNKIISINKTSKLFQKIAEMECKEIFEINIDLEKIQHQATEIQQLKKQIEELKHSNKSELNLKKYTYNAITIYDKKQRKKIGIEKIHEEILSINNEIYFITTFVHDNQSITEEIICFQELTNGNIEVMKQLKKYENINKYKDDLLLIEPNSNHEKNIKVEHVSIKEFLSEQEKLSNWKISKSERIIFISLSLLSITLLAIPVVVPALVPIISTILWEKTLVSIIGIGIAWIVNKGIWTIATEKTKKVESWMKQSFYSLIRKIPFVNKRNLGKTKEELEIKKNVEKTIENLTSDKLETKLKSQLDLLKSKNRNSG